MIVLGIDPGPANTGYGVVARRGRLVALDGGVIETAAGLAPSAGWPTSTRASRSCSTSTSPPPWRSRSSTSGQNVRTAFAVGQARGVVMLAAGQRGVPCAAYTPQQVKGAVCGSGRAAKDQVARMVAAPARRCPSRRSPTTPPTRSPSRSATPTARRSRRALAEAARDRAASRRGRRAPRPTTWSSTAAASATGWRCPPRRCATCPRVGEPVPLHAHLVVRDDALAALRLRHRGGARPVPDAARRAVGRPEGRARRPLAAARRASCCRARGRRRGALPGRAGHRQAHGRADHRRAAREGRRASRRGGGAISVTRAATTRATLARDGLLELGFSRRRGADGCSTSAEGDTAEELIGQRAARRAARRSHARDERIQTPAALAGRGRARPLAAPARARGVRRPGGAARAARGRDRGRRRPRRGARPRAARRPARAGQDLAGADRRRRARRAVRADRRPGARAQGRHRRASSPRWSRAASSSSTRSTGSRALEETFYPAMEDRRLPITVGQGAGARVVTLDLPPFTLIGATTRAGLLTTPLRDRFGIQHRLEPYGAEDLARIVRRSAAILERRARRRRRRGDRGARARHAARGQPAAQARARLRRGPRQRRRRRRGAADAALDLLEVDERGPRPPRPRDPAGDLREVRRRPGRPVDAGGRGRRGARHDRGRLRALPAPAGPAPAHAARPRGDRRAPTRTSGSSAARGDRRCSEPGRRASRASATALGIPRPALRCMRTLVERMAHLFICPNCGNRHDRPIARAGFRRQPKGCSKCGFGVPVRAARRLLPGARRRLLRLRPARAASSAAGAGSFELTGPRRRATSSAGRSTTCSACSFDDGDDHVGTVARVGRARARQARAGQRRGRPAGARPPPTSSRPTTTTAACCSCSPRTSSRACARRTR